MKQYYSEGPEAVCCRSRSRWIGYSIPINEYTAVHQSKSSPGCDSKFSATYPSIHESSGGHVTGPVPIHVPPPTPPYKKTVSTFSIFHQPSEPPHYSSVTPQVGSDPGLKSRQSQQSTKSCLRPQYTSKSTINRRLKVL